MSVPPLPGRLWMSPSTLRRRPLPRTHQEALRRKQCATCGILRAMPCTHLACDGQRNESVGQVCVYGNAKTMKSALMLVKRLQVFPTRTNLNTPCQRAKDAPILGPPPVDNHLLWTEPQALHGYCRARILS